ncbi:MAG: DUF86 domain-containing protein [Thermoproteus sp.]
MAVVSRLLRIVEERAALLDRIGPEELGDFKAYFSAVYLLQTQAQALIDMAQRAAALKGLEVGGYVDAGEKLRLLGVIDDEDLKLYKALVAFRNIVVHQYAAVDIEVVRKVVAGREYRKVVDLARKIARAVEDP